MGLGPTGGAVMELEVVISQGSIGLGSRMGKALGSSYVLIASLASSVGRSVAAW
jgi:hypothetical protein